MKVKATKLSKMLGIKLKELHRVAQPEEVFNVTEDRFHYLSGNNPFHKAFVTALDGTKSTKHVETTVSNAGAAKVSIMVDADVATKEVEPIVEPVVENVEPVVQEEKPKKKSTKKKKSE